MSQPHDVDIPASDEEPDSTSVAGSSLEEMLCAQTEDIEDQQPGDILFSPAQMSVIQETVSSSVREAMLAFHHQDVSPRSIGEPRTPSPRLSNVATPLGLNRQVWTRRSRTKYSAVSTSISLCFSQTIFIGPSSPPCRFGTKTLPQAPRVPRLPWLSGKSR